MNMGAVQGPADGPFPEMRTETARVVVEDYDNEPCFDSAEEKAAAERAHLTARARLGYSSDMVNMGGQVQHFPPGTTGLLGPLPTAGPPLGASAAEHALHAAHNQSVAHHLLSSAHAASTAGVHTAPPGSAAHTQSAFDLSHAHHAAHGGMHAVRVLRCCLFCIYMPAIDRSFL